MSSNRLWQFEAESFSIVFAGVPGGMTLSTGPPAGYSRTGRAPVVGGGAGGDVTDAAGCDVADAAGCDVAVELTVRDETSESELSLQAVTRSAARIRSALTAQGLRTVPAWAERRRGVPSNGRGRDTPPSAARGSTRGSAGRVLTKAIPSRPHQQPIACPQLGADHSEIETRFQLSHSPDQLSSGTPDTPSSGSRIGIGAEAVGRFRDRQVLSVH
jgi:hypothetical protein